MLMFCKDLMVKFHDNMLQFYEDRLEYYGNGIVKYYDDLMPVILEWIIHIPQLIALLNNNSSQEDSDNDLPNDPDGPSPGPGPDGDDSEPEDNDSNKNKKLDKGKGKAKATTPELIPEETEVVYTEYEEKIFQQDLEKARWESLKKDKKGESSKDGATLQEREDEEARLDSLQEHAQSESPKEGANLEQSESTETQKEDNTELSSDHYYNVSGMRRQMAEEFNDITMKLNSKDNDLSQEQREHLLNASVQLRKEVTNYDNYLQHLREVLNIQPEDECSSQDNSGEEYSSDYSSDEESRPAKRPKK
jgi:hypothetical protein